MGGWGAENDKKMYVAQKNWILMKGDINFGTLSNRPTNSNFCRGAESIAST